MAGFSETTEKRMNSVLETKAAEHHGDWRDDFFRNGYVVLKGAVSTEKAGAYRQRMFNWIESFPGVKLNDKSTWTKEILPWNFKSMYLNYCAAHEKFVWDARTEPNVLQPFQKLWGTEELLASFDGFNITLPGQKDLDFTPWPHVDQSHKRIGLHCAQGLLNLGPAGPDDGGLLLMEGSSVLFEEFFKVFPPAAGDVDETKQYDFFGFSEEHVKWFESKGCYLRKICMDPGDLVIWDSRTLHYVRLPAEDRPIRTVIYTCFTPRALATKEDIALKAELFKRFEGTTHWPHCNIFSHGKAKLADGSLDPRERYEPLEKPIVTDQILRLAGVEPYPSKALAQHMEANEAPSSVMLEDTYPVHQGVAAY